MFERTFHGTQVVGKVCNRVSAMDRVIFYVASKTYLSHTLPAMAACRNLVRADFIHHTFRENQVKQIIISNFVEMFWRKKSKTLFFNLSFCNFSKCNVYRWVGRLTMRDTKRTTADGGTNNGFKL